MDTDVSPNTDSKRLSERLIGALAAAGHGNAVSRTWQRDAAKMFHRCGSAWNELIILNDIMSDFSRSVAAGDPMLSYYSFAASLTKGMSPVVMARKCYEVSLALASDSAETMYCIAALDLRAGNNADAFRRWQRVSEVAATGGKRSPSHVKENAFWRCGEEFERTGEDLSAARCFQLALNGIGSVGPDQRKYPLLLQRVGQLEMAAEAFDAVMTYSHRYAPEFAATAGGENLIPPSQADGSLSNPFAVATVGRTTKNYSILYFCGLFFRVPETDMPITDGQVLLDGVTKTSRFWRFRQTGIGCAPRPDFWSPLL